MTTKRATKLLLAAVTAGALGGLLSGACSGEDDPSQPPVGGAHAGGGTAAGTGSGGELFGGHGPTDIESIEISPADPLIVVTDGVANPPSITFTAVGKTANDVSVPVSGSWSYDRYDVGAIDSVFGEFTPTGFVGGVGTVTFTTETLTGTTTATVKLHLTSDPESIDPGIKAEFGGASQSDPALALLYPYDQTIFPRGLIGPTVQWNGGNPGDIYYLHATSPTFEFEAWGTVPPPSRYDFPTAPTDVWRVLTDSTEGDITVDIQRYDGSQAYLAETQTWTIAPAVLTGTVYYWAISWGDVVRLKMGEPAPESFLQQPQNTTCIACHSVSAKGNRIVAALNGGRSPWATFDAETGALEYDSRINPPAQPGHQDYNRPGSGFEAISPEGDYVLWGHWDDSMQIYPGGHLKLSTYDDRTELAQLDPPGGGGPSHPVWSPDGTKVAFSVRTEAGGLYFTHSTLWIADVDLGVPTFLNIQEIVTNDATDTVVTYPTFSPASNWVSFMRGNHAYCDSEHVGSPVYGDIWMSKLDGSAQVELDALNGNGSLATPDDELNYQPSFLPVQVGGYWWLVFATERQYGNTLTYAPNDLNSRRKQLWVAAVDPNPPPGQDPSHPPFWLPGQDVGTENMRGQWALSPCKQIGEVCLAGYECCDGFCREDENGVLVCQDTPGPCSHEGEACTTAADCCDPQAQCIGGYCAAPPPQ